MKGNRMFNGQVRLFGLAAVLAWSAAAHGQGWISFVEDPSRISAGTDPTGLSVINDLPCNPNCTQTCNSFTPCSGVCRCACEKDMAVGDLDKSFPLRDDLVMVRIQPFMQGGGVSNLLFMNENGIMVDRTADFAPCFADPTQDRDVVIVDVDAVLGSPDNLPDVVIASTFGEQPRVYINLGNDVNGNWRGLCLCYDKATDTCHDATYRAANGVCRGPTNDCFDDIPALSDDLHIDPFNPAPKFCGVAAGDLNDDDCDDLYFVDYANNLEDRLLFNTKVGDVCTGFFDDVTETPSTRLCPNGPPCFNESGFGTGARIVDIDLDGNNDIVKGEDTKLDILYNDAGNVGHFDVKHDLDAEFTGTVTPYMFAAGDMNGDLGVDLYVVRSDQFEGAADKFLINECFQADPLPPECDRPPPDEGTVQFRSAKLVEDTNRTDYPGGNVALIDLDGDNFPDVLLADVDVEGSLHEYLEAAPNDRGPPGPAQRYGA